MAITLEDFQTRIEELCRENGIEITNGGADTTAPQVWKLGDLWSIPKVTFSNTFEGTRVHRLRLFIHNDTQNWLCRYDITFHNRPICVGDKTFDRSIEDVFATLMKQSIGKSDQQITELLISGLTGKSGIYSEKVHSADGRYRTEKIFKVVNPS